MWEKQTGTDTFNAETNNFFSLEQNILGMEVKYVALKPKMYNYILTSFPHLSTPKNSIHL